MTPNDRNDGDYDDPCPSDDEEYGGDDFSDDYTNCVKHCECWYAGMDCCFCDGFPDCDYKERP